MKSRSIGPGFTPQDGMADGFAKRWKGLGQGVHVHMSGADDVRSLLGFLRGYGFLGDGLETHVRHTVRDAGGPPRRRDGNCCAAVGGIAWVSFLGHRIIVR